MSVDEHSLLGKILADDNSSDSKQHHDRFHRGVGNVVRNSIILVDFVGLRVMRACPWPMPAPMPVLFATNFAHGYVGLIWRAGRSIALAYLPLGSL
jgi:hypothetical protein